MNEDRGPPYLCAHRGYYVLFTADASSFFQMYEILWALTGARKWATLSHIVQLDRWFSGRLLVIWDILIISSQFKTLDLKSQVESSNK